MNFKRRELQEKKTWAWEGIIGGLVGGITLGVYLVIAKDVHPALVLLVLLAGPIIGYIGAIADYNRHVFLRRFRRSDSEGEDANG